MGVEYERLAALPTRPAGLREQVSDIAAENSVNQLRELEIRRTDHRVLESFW